MPNAGHRYVCFLVVGLSSCTSPRSEGGTAKSDASSSGGESSNETTPISSAAKPDAGNTSLVAPGSSHDQTAPAGDTSPGASESLDNITVGAPSSSTHSPDVAPLTDTLDTPEVTHSQTERTDVVDEGGTSTATEPSSAVAPTVDSIVSASDSIATTAAPDLTLELPVVEPQDGGGTEASVNSTASGTSGAIETAIPTPNQSMSDGGVPYVSRGLPSTDSVGLEPTSTQVGSGTSDATEISVATTSAAATTLDETFATSAALDAAVTEDTVCGDGRVTGVEACDDGDTANGDGCSGNCSREFGYACIKGLMNQPGESGVSVCYVTICGDGIADGDEGCDDGNTIAGDGCGPTCQNEPTFVRTLVDGHYDPVAQLACGDGLLTRGEECDDGNTLDSDGCSSSCSVENGYACEQFVQYPDAVTMEVRYRDFKQRSNNSGGHPHMRVSGASPPASGNDFGITGTLCTAANQATCSHLDGDGKPMYVGGNEAIHPTIDYTGDNLTASYHQEAFRLWYRDTNLNSAGTGAVNDPASEADGNPNTNVPIGIAPNPGACNAGVCPIAPAPQVTADTLTLSKLTGLGSPDVPSTYQFSSNGNWFYPLGSASSPSVGMRGFGYVTVGGNSNKNWHFTTELRYFFQYQGGETLTFFSDDDLWVFINGRLAVDVGGLHATAYGRVVLGDEDADCTTPTSLATYSSSAPAACSREDSEVTDAIDDRFQLTKGGVYEIVVLQAERTPTGANIQLSLAGFFVARSFCTYEGERLDVDGSTPP